MNKIIKDTAFFLFCNIIVGKMKNFLIQIAIILALTISAVIAILFLINNVFGINLIPNMNEQTKVAIPSDIDVALTFTQYTKELNSILSTVTVRLSTNKPIRLINQEKYKIVYQAQSDNRYDYIVEIFNLGFGENTRNIELQTELSEEILKQLSQEQINLNKATATYKITRENFNLPFNMNTIGRFEESSFVFDGDDLSAPVSKLKSLPSDYQPEDLVDLNKDKLLYTNISGIMLRREAADALAIMLKELKKITGRDVVIASGYRSFENQTKTYMGWVRQFGIEGADKISARPGFSEHQLGTAVDFFDVESGFEFTNNFDVTKAGTWLKENSYKYGFVQSYPSGSEGQTGYSHEAWHYRYIGIDLAEKYHLSGKTLNNFLDSLDDWIFVSR